MSRSQFLLSFLLSRLTWLMFEVVTLLGFGLNFFGKNVYEAFLRAHERVPSVARPVVWASVGLLALVLKTRDVAPYIYFGF